LLFDKVVVLDSVIFFPEHRERLDRIAREVVEYNTCTSEDEVSARCAGADAIISCWVDIPHRIIDENPQLKAIAFWTHDFEHRIDADYAKSRGIHVPAIPDYGTDSVAELVFLGLLSMFANRSAERTAVDEEIVFRFGDDVRQLSSNTKDNLTGRWFHEYVKTGQLRINSADGIPAETLKGLTVGVLGPDLVTPGLVQLVTHGLGMNLVYSLADAPHTMDTAFRPVDSLLDEAQILVYDSARHPWVAERITGRSHLRSVIDVAKLEANRASLRDKMLGILGLGRIGSRVAQIATQGFGMPVVYHSRTRKPELEEAWGLQYVSLEDVFTSCDILTIHLPHHGAEEMVSRKLVNSIPDGTVFVNCSVGSVLEDEDELLDRCERGELRAFLDVYRTLPPRARLRALRDDVLATYRLGWRTKATVGLKTHKLLTKLENPPQPYQTRAR
jgi:lactate dehydrogenase-like 2-hydroxyacid dehydrogenase